MVPSFLALFPLTLTNAHPRTDFTTPTEYPCSPARADPVEISCTDFQTVADAGGKCPEDTTNIVLLFKELSAALTPLGKLVSLASQAGKPQEIEQAVALLHPYLSHFNVMSYDYAVSDLDGSSMNFSPNCPLYTPSANGTVQMSVNYTVHNYLSVGVPPEKLMIGFAYYGHTFFNPTLKGDDWKAFGGPTYVQGSCCGPFATTFGGKPGLGAQQCGTLMFSELQAALGSANASSTFFDVETQSDIAYFSAQGADGSTTAGTWVTYNGFESGRAFARYTKQMGLRGLFIFDTSMDTMDSNGDFTYELSNAIADELAKA
jgi:GH18 family chitinase